MMFDDNLPISLCEKYNVEQNTVEVVPILIRHGNQMYKVTIEGVKRIECPTYNLSGDWVQEYIKQFGSEPSFF